MINLLHLAKWSLVILLVTVAFTFPMIAGGPAKLHIAIMIGIMGIVVTAFRLILRIGYISLAQAAFFGIGAYTSALLTTNLGWSSWAALLPAGLLAASIALVVGIPTLRVRGVYFVIATFALGEVIRQIWIQWDSLFGGLSGLVGVPGFSSIGGVDFISKTSIYYVVFIIWAAIIVIIYLLDRSRIGLTFSAIENSDDLARSIGIRSFRYRLFAFTLACFFTGIAGALFASYVRLVHPYDFSVQRAIDIVIYTIVGGPASVLGPAVGTVFFRGILEPQLHELKHYTPIIMGGILILVMLFVPGGFYGIPGQMAQWWNNQRRRWQRLRGQNESAVAS